jgi:FtsZ-interacting cell division protein ZipA
MTTSELSLVPAQADAPPPVDSAWQYIFADPSFVVINIALVTILISVLWIVRRRYARFFSLQREALDHRKTANSQMLNQNQSFEQLVARQYGQTNAHNQAAMAKADEALRLNAETLAQITAMNRTLARIAERLDQPGGSAA